MVLIDVYVTLPSKPSDGFTLTHGLTIIGMLVNIGIGIWLGVTFKKNYETTKSVKDYFISESKQFLTEYNQLLSLLLEEKLSSSDCMVWFKKTTKRIECFETFLKSEFMIESKILATHNKLKWDFMQTEFFNANYKQRKLKLTFHAQIELTNGLNNFSEANNRLVVSIIKSQPKKIKRWNKIKILFLKTLRFSRKTLGKSPSRSK